MSPRRGFTLIEVVVVLTLLGIVAAVTIPAFRGGESQDAHTTVAQSVVKLLRTTRAIALTKATVATLRIDPAESRFWFDADSGGQARRGTEGVLALPAGVTLLGSSERLAFRFLPTGEAEPESLVVRGPGGSLVIRVDRWTGEPSVR